MGFTTKNQAAPLTDLELETQKEKLLEDIQHISEKIGEAQKIESEYNQKSFDLSELKELVAREQLTLETLLSELDSKKQEVVEVGLAIKGMEEHRDKLGGVLIRLQEDIATAEAHLKSSKDLMEDEVSQAKSEISGLRQELVKLQEDRDGLVRASAEVAEGSAAGRALLEKQTESIAALSDELELKTKRSLGLDEDIRKKQVELVDLMEDERVAKEAVVVAEKKAEQIVSDANDYRAKIEADLNVREGGISIKESWLAEKEQTLKNTKEELEKFYNRPINNVRF